MMCYYLNVHFQGQRVNIPIIYSLRKFIFTNCLNIEGHLFLTEILFTTRTISTVFFNNEDAWKLYK